MDLLLCQGGLCWTIWMFMDGVQLQGLHVEERVAHICMFYFDIVFGAITLSGASCLCFTLGWLQTCTVPSANAYCVIQLAATPSTPPTLSTQLPCTCYILRLYLKRHLPNGYDYMGKQYLVMDLSSVSMRITCTIWWLDPRIGILGFWF